MRINPNRRKKKKQAPLYVLVLYLVGGKEESEKTGKWGLSHGARG
jgi:hypothetical protein